MLPHLTSRNTSLNATPLLRASLTGSVKPSQTPPAVITSSPKPLNLQGFPCSLDGKLSAYNAGDPGSIPGLGRSTRERNGNPLQYCCLENPMDGGAQ